MDEFALDLRIYHNSPSRCLLHRRTLRQQLLRIQTYINDIYDLESSCALAEKVKFHEAYLGGRSYANELTSADYDTALDTDLLDLREESVVLHPDDVRGWEKVGKFRGRRTLSPNPGSNLTGHSVGTGNKFDVLSDTNTGNEVAIEKTVKFVHDERQKYFEKRLGNLLNQFEIDREQRRNAGVNSERPAPDSETEKTAETQPPPIVNKGKVREFRDTGIPGIDNADLDPEAQRRAWENFDFLKKEDPELQRIIYEGIVTGLNTYRNNGTKAGTPGADRAGPSNSSPPKKGMRVEIVEELYGEDDVSDKQSSPTPAGLETNPVPSETLDTSEISLPMGDKNPKTERNANFEPPVTSTPTSKAKKKVKIVEEHDDNETLDLHRGANRSGGSGSSSLPLSHAGTSGDNRGRSPMSGLIRPGNPHIDLQNMINVSRNAMYSGKGKDNPNVRTGPAFAADQVAPNSYLGKLLKKSASGKGMDLPPDDPGNSGPDESSAPSSEDESGRSGDESDRDGK
ncbi:hypothetical protein EDD18DRAFT_1361817 [Armillaria luteobubalina]|uniref:Uncharacterized protein n=1 Tax=Armillaria luteobubalina TaxID=153913 RepID=A0AA39UCJ3_9AGAR|nr:hypothetical protein EDD18DRAFT_1361817 [Armillaria luteobubalina]